MSQPQVREGGPWEKMKTTMSINQIIDQWLENTDIVEISRYYYKQKILQWFHFLSARKKDPRSPSRKDVIEYKQYLETSGYSELTVGSYITVVKLFYRYLEENKYYENIAAGIRSLGRYKGHRKRALDENTAHKLLESIDSRTEIGMRDRLMISLMLFYGLRTCEVERLDIADFTVAGELNLMRIQRKGRREKKEQIAVSRHIVEMMEEYISCRDFQPQDPLFIVHSSFYHGRRLCRKTISSIVKRRLRAIGVYSRDITAHSLRHTCASMLIASGVALADVQDILGHSDIATTRIYTVEAQREKLLQNNPSLLIEDKLLKGIKQPII